MIKLIGDTISHQDIDSLIEWLKEYPRLTMGDVTVQFEEAYSKWIGSKFSVFCNSGSSANLLMIATLIDMKLMKNNKVLIPALCWATTIAPVLQMGLEPIIIDIDLENLGCCLDSLQDVLQKEDPAVLMITNVLGFPNKMKEIMALCKQYNVILIEDSCETQGSSYNNRKCGTFGLMGSFSFYMGHVSSTIEGGMICTDDYNIYQTLKMLRSHGWTRNLDEQTKKHYRDIYNVNGFEELYTFYKCGFNLRSTDLQAKIGLLQLAKLDNFCSMRHYNFNIFQTLIKNTFWKPSPIGEYIVNFAYPIIHPKKELLVDELIKNEIECRPLICGAISQQPFIKDRNIKCYDYKNSKIVNKYGLYAPNHQDLTIEEISFMCNIINGVINK